MNFERTDLDNQISVYNIKFKILVESECQTGFFKMAILYKEYPINFFSEVGVFCCTFSMKKKPRKILTNAVGGKNIKIPISC